MKASKTENRFSTNEIQFAKKPVLTSIVTIHQSPTPNGQRSVDVITMETQYMKSAFSKLVTYRIYLLVEWSPINISAAMSFLSGTNGN